ncbi:MAG TPA: arylsulfotransferase family protein [Gaiellaceae bacterium]
MRLLALAALAVPGTVTPHTLPALHVPVPKVTHAAHGTAPGYVFLAEKQGGKPGGPLIVDDRGRVVWYGQLAAPVQATDFRVQRYRGRPVLTWWQGRESAVGIGQGVGEIYDTRYRHVATVRAVGRGLQADLHEFQLTPRGTAFLTAYREVRADLRSVGGPRRGWAYDSVVEEVDIATGRLVFEWHSIGHVPFAESVQARRPTAVHATKAKPLDYFHVNSVSDGPGGTILVSARNTSTIYLLARDGHIVWRLGGKRSDFGPARAVRFALQHDPRLHGSLLTLFDNGGDPRVEPASRPLELRLDLEHRRARVVRTFVPPRRIASPYEGNLQLLPGGGAFVGWGGIPEASEFGPDGSLRFQLELPYGDSYRAYREPWRGRPVARPLVAIARGTVYASWNGATGVARWEVLGGRDAAHLHRLASVPWNGLETAIGVGGSPGVVRVRALDAAGRVLATSLPAGAGSPPTR